MKKKRILAYLVDILIVMAFLAFINMIMPNNINEQNLVLLNESYINKHISFSEYYNQYIVITHNIAKSEIGFNILNLVIMIIYFVMIPFLNKGATIGKNIFKIKVRHQNNENLELNDLVGRSVLIDGIGYLLFLIVLVNVLPPKGYFWFENILGIIQILVVITSGFMVLYRKDQLGLQDILTNTLVEEME